MMYCTHTMVMYRWQNKLYLTMCTTATWSFLYNKSLRISIAINSTERCIYTPWIEQLIDLDTTPESKLKESPLSKFKSTFKSRIFFSSPSERLSAMNFLRCNREQTFSHVCSPRESVLSHRGQSARFPTSSRRWERVFGTCLLSVTHAATTDTLTAYVKCCWTPFSRHHSVRFFSAAAIICYPGLFKAHLAVEKLKVEMALINRSWERQKQNVYSLKTQIKPTCFGQWP